MFDDDEPDGFPHVIEDAVFAFFVLAIVTGIAAIIRFAFFWSPL